MVDRDALVEKLVKDGHLPEDAFSHELKRFFENPENASLIARVQEEIESPAD